MNENNERTGGPLDIEGIIADIMQGKEYEVIALKWGTTPDYVKKIVTEMKKQGEELIDRRSKQWRTLQIMTIRQYNWKDRSIY